MVTAAMNLAGCSTPPRLDALPSSAGAVSFVRITNARYDGDDAEALKQEIWQSLTREWPKLSSDMLALSGGGEDGAFGAGVLVGWSEHGDRPQFKIVTGASTGALAAPFAFLGSEYDDALRKIYTETRAEEIVSGKRLLLTAVNNDALMDSAPLARSIAKHLDIKILDRIAEEYEKGRLLLVSTTNLDTGKLVIWNLGAIAASGHPRRLELVRKVVLASAAIPGLFPPVMINVQLDESKHQEMHVDGGTVSQIFLYPPSLRLGHILQRDGSPRPTAYIIRNGRTSPTPEKVERRTLAIAGRAIETMIASNGVGDLYRIYATTQRDHIDFNLALIGDDFKLPHTTPFDRAYMAELFAHGMRLGRAGYPWQKVPPGYAQ
jgi:predicted acylesterase/phospholipase RssA